MEFSLPTFVGTLVTFVIFIGFCWKFIWPAMITAMDARRARIAEGLANAEKAEAQLAQSEAQVKESLHAARGESQKLIDQARAQANSIIEDAKVQARAESERILEAAQTEIDQETNRAREQLRHEVADLAVLAAEKILEEEIDGKRHTAMIDRLVQGL